MGGAQSNIVGGTTGGERNTISGNDENGVVIWGSGANNNIVSGNFIGTDVSGAVDLGNTYNGVVMGDGARWNTIGGATPDESNLISGNDENGVSIWNPGTSNNKVSGNYIGTDVSGTAALGNSWNGVGISEGAQSNTIGGTAAGERNIISGNNGNGVLMDSSSTNNVVCGNYIGTDVGGTVDLGNAGNGIAIWGEAQSNTVGGMIPGERNIISGNDDNGVGIWNPGTNNNIVSGNFIGTDVTGTANLGNSFTGVTIGDGAQSNTIGGTTPGERNIISGNIHGIGIWNSGTNNNVVSGNYIGTDVTGTVKLENSGNGVAITGQAQSNTVGGTTAGERNIISGNGSNGVIIKDSDTENNRISGNYIGTDAGGTAALGNTASGVRIDSGAKSNIIGGATAGERNIISGNNGGVIIDHSGTDGNRVSGNYIGTDVNGSAALGNIWAGVGIYGGAQSNTIGGTTDGERNVISGNNASGVLITGSGTSSNVVSGNYIGTDVTGTVDLGNSRIGVIIVEGAQSNTIGGTSVGTGNIIAFNDQTGVTVMDESTDFNRISRNSMHDNASLGIDLVDGGNDEIPAPTITSGDLLGNILTVSGTGAGAGATVEVFEADSFASGEGMTYLGSLTADGGGGFSGPLDVTGMGISAGDPLVATTTHTNNNTSEFSSTYAVTVSYVLIPATIDLDPDTLNLKAKGKWVSCYIELSEDYEEYSVEQIDTTSVKLWVEGSHIPAEEKPITVGDHDKDDIPDLMVKFDRVALMEYLSPADDVSEAAASEYVTLTVNGQVGDDAIFEGTDTVKITGSDTTNTQEALAAPAKTSEFALYQNFPNSFNPDTWIPYGLAEDAEVTITIYSVSGELIRILDLGHKPAGFYTTRSKAAYWDGRNEAGEQVSSGIYFYTIRAGSFTAGKKLIIAR